MNWPLRWLPYDLYERHAVVSRLLRRALGDDRAVTVLDVGGRVGLLSRFLPVYRVTSINTDGTGHLLGSGLALPFPDDSFAAVVSVDTLEHLPPARRVPFLREGARVARRCLIVAAPFGSEQHRAYERHLDDLYRSAYGHPHPYLGEHIRYGLPTPDEIADFIRALPDARVEQFFAGDYRWQGRRFARSIAPGGRRGLLRRLSDMGDRLTGAALFHPIRLRREPTAATNRFYLLVSKPTRG